jgi:hypothetical protein
MDTCPAEFADGVRMITAITSLKQADPGKAKFVSPDECGFVKF